MSKVTSIAILDRFLNPLADCLTTEAARRILDLGLDPEIQTRLDDLAIKASEGQLSTDENEEYAELIEGLDVIGILKAKARLVLVRNHS